MCDVIIPALIGVGALALLGGGGAVGGGCDNCPTGPVPACIQTGNATITIPQLAGEGTNVQVVSGGQQFAYAPPPQGPAAYAPSYGSAPAYGANAGYAPAPGPVPGPSYGPAPAAPMGHYDAVAPGPQPYSAYPGDAGVGASIDYNGQSAIGAGGYADPNSVGIGANVGGVDASVGLGSRAY